MSSKFIYSDNIPKEVLPLIKEKLAPFEDFLPGWVTELRVYWDLKPTVSGTSTGDLAYRNGYITFYPPFLDEKPDEQLNTALHEVIHIIISPLVNFYQQLFNCIPDVDEKIKNFIDQEFDEKLEGITVDLTTVLLQLTNKNQEKSTLQSVGPKKVPVKKKKVSAPKKRKKQ
jgi:hypothetical protein